MLLHITTRQNLAAAKGSGLYVDDSLETEGFIHASTPEQVLIPANERFRGRDDLVLAVIDPERLDCEVIYEDCYESGHEFPHIYGPIPLAAISAVIDMPARSDGYFELPELPKSPNN